MLTQTKPDVSTPVIYRSWSPSQDPAALASQATGPPPTTQRMPLRTLSLTSDSLSPSQPHRLSRLIKGKDRAHSPDNQEHAASSSSKPNDAFSVLLKGAQKQNAKKLLQKSEFIEGEAQESDEDENFGFGGPKKADDDESDSDDLDANVEGLLDDTVIDAEQLAEDKVLEKVQLVLFPLSGYLRSSPWFIKKTENNSNKMMRFYKNTTKMPLKENSGRKGVGGALQWTTVILTLMKTKMLVSYGSDSTRSAKLRETL